MNGNNENLRKSDSELRQLVYEQNLQQTKWIKRQTIFVSLLLLVVAVALILLSIQVSNVLGEANAAIDEIARLTHELNNVLDESHLTELLQNANTLIEESGESLTKALDGVDEALKKVEQIDIDALNSAISDLQKVIDPLARLFGKK